MLVRAFVEKIYVVKIFVFLTIFSLNVHAVCKLEDEHTGKTFRIFNALLFKDMPDMSSLCIEPINVMYAWEFFPRGSKHGNLTMPTSLKMSKAISVAKEKNQITVIDIEHWPLKNATAEVLTVSAKNYFDVIRIFKKGVPNIAVGYYGIVPTIDFSRSKFYTKGSRYNEWVAENNRVVPIAALVDAVFPSLYTINSDRISWLGRAKSHIVESIRLAPGKPIYPFIWPHYHEQGGKYPVGTEVDPDYWKIQLEYLRDNADGFVLWGGYKQDWKKDMEWWKVLAKFIQTSFVISSEDSKRNERSIK